MPNTIELYANNARTTLAGSANNTVTTLVLQSGAGALFPSPNNTIGEYAKATLQDSATGLRNEIVYITARTGDVLTVIRGQDGSTAQTWSAGDTVFEGVTAATLASFVQPSKLQSGEYIYASATGTTSAYVATLTPAIATVNAGMVVRINTNTVGTNTTTTPTLNVNGLGAFTIVKQGGALRVGDMPKMAQLQYDSTLTQWILLNPAIQGTLLNIQKFETAGTFTYTPTTGTKSVIVEVVGGGGGGGGTPVTTVSQSAAGSGACGGGKSTSFLESGFSGVTITVGAGGVGVLGANGTAGGTSSFGSFITCTGGEKGNLGAIVSSGISAGVGSNSGGTATGGNITNERGEGGGAGLIVSQGCLSGAGGGSNITARAISVTGFSAGFSSLNNGGGGGGAGIVLSAYNLALKGGDGKAGAVTIWEYN